MRSEMEKKIFKAFDRVDSRYGAPMGRRDVGKIGFFDNLCVCHQGGSDGYDRGGAYWGLPRNVYCVWVRGDGWNRRTYIRASSGADAIAKARGLPGARYAVRGGFDLYRAVCHINFQDELIGFFPDLDTARQACHTHNTKAKESADAPRTS